MGKAGTRPREGGKERKTCKVKSGSEFGITYLYRPLATGEEGVYIFAAFPLLACHFVSYLSICYVSYLSLCYQNIPVLHGLT